MDEARVDPLAVLLGEDVLQGVRHQVAVTAAVGLVADPSVPRRPRFDAVVVGVGAVVFLEIIVGAHPAIEDADENAVAAVGAVVLEKYIAVAAAFDEDTRGIAGMNFVGVFTDPVT